jgi:hypothetical protein
MEPPQQNQTDSLSDVKTITEYSKSEKTIANSSTQQQQQQQQQTSQEAESAAPQNTESIVKQSSSANQVWRPLSNASTFTNKKNRNNKIHKNNKRTKNQMRNKNKNAEVQEEKHTLQTVWTFWYSKQSNETTTQRGWAESLHKIGTINTIEGFWR